MSTIKKTAENVNFTAVNLGELNKLSEFSLSMGPGQEVKGKAFLKDAIKSTGSEISYNFLPPKTEIPFFHTHKKNEEVYLILSGSGKFQVDDDCFDISEGSVVRVAPAGKRGMINTSDKGMIYVVIQSKESSLEEHTGGDGTIFNYTPEWKK